MIAGVPEPEHATLERAKQESWRADTGSNSSNSMGKLFAFIGSTIGGYIGWYIGAPVGFTTAFIVSMVGTGIGMYYGRVVAKTYIE